MGVEGVCCSCGTMLACTVRQAQAKSRGKPGPPTPPAVLTLRHVEEFEDLHTRLLFENFTAVQQCRILKSGKTEKGAQHPHLSKETTK